MDQGSRADMPLKRIAIIGAGATGMVQLKNVLDVFSRPEVRYELEVVVFESKSEVGGVWYSDEKEKPHCRAVHHEKGKGKEPDHERMYFYPPANEDPSPMYEGLHTNLPNELMAFRDFPFPEGTPLFPDRRIVQKYLEDYADHFDLRRHIRFNTRVERLHQSRIESGSTWTIESRSANREIDEKDFDHVCVSNGHYSDGWIPEVSGLSNFGGLILHSRYYLRPEDYAGRTVLVVGSFASGSDIARQIASLNIGAYDPQGRPTTPQSESNFDSSKSTGFTKVYVSSSAGSSPSTSSDPTTPWMRYISYRPLMSHVGQDGSIVFQEDAEPLRGVDTMIFATGYNFSLPFCKATDSPWDEMRILDDQIRPGERDGGFEEEVGGMKGLGMEGLDPLLMFLENDPSRSIAFPVLQYQIVPFPLAETQTRLTAMLWSSVLTTLPDDTQPPPNPSNPYSTPAPSPPSDEASGEKPPVRKVVQMRKKLVFGAPYEFEYQEYLMSLMQHLDDPEWVKMWWNSMPIKKRWRQDTGLRKRTLGY